MINIDDYMLDGHVDQPLWIPANYRNFIQTYKRFPTKESRRLVLYYSRNDETPFFILKLDGIKKGFGSDTNNVFRRYETMFMPDILNGIMREKISDCKDGLKSICETKEMDAFFIEGMKYDFDMDDAKEMRSNYQEAVDYINKFALVYFSQGYADGSYENKSKVPEPDHVKDSISKPN